MSFQLDLYKDKILIHRQTLYYITSSITLFKEKLNQASLHQT